MYLWIVSLLPNGQFETRFAEGICRDCILESLPEGSKSVTVFAASRQAAAMTALPTLCAAKCGKQAHREFEAARADEEFMNGG